MSFTPAEGQFLHYLIPAKFRICLSTMHFFIPPVKSWSSGPGSILTMLYNRSFLILALANFFALSSVSTFFSSCYSACFYCHQLWNYDAYLLRWRFYPGSVGFDLWFRGTACCIPVSMPSLCETNPRTSLAKLWEFLPVVSIAVYLSGQFCLATSAIGMATRCCFWLPA